MWDNDTLHKTLGVQTFINMSANLKIMAQMARKGDHERKTAWSLPINQQSPRIREEYRTGVVQGLVSWAALEYVLTGLFPWYL